MLTIIVIDLFPEFKSFISKLPWVVFIAFCIALETGMICLFKPFPTCKFIPSIQFVFFHGRTKKGWSIETIIAFLNSWNVTTFWLNSICKNKNKNILFLRQCLLLGRLFMSFTQGGMFCVRNISFHCLFCAKF